MNIKRFFSSLSLIIIALTLFAGVTPGMVKIYDEEDVDLLIEAGVSIERRRGNILLCYFPFSAEEDIIITNDKKPDEGISTRSIAEGINEFKTGGRTFLFHNKRRSNTPTLDQAINFFEAGQIQSGSAFERSLTGSGVITGLCDIGLDPLHPTFLDENGRSRIKRITHYKEFEGERRVLEGDEAYKEWKTDSIAESHATHVAGIMAGGGAGSQFRGIASDSEIVASVSCLTDFGLLMGVEDIIDYAKEVGKPAVINLSMGNYTGAHDGTSLFSQYLDMCADDAIIVLSAGNEGDHTNYLTTRLDEDTRQVHFRLGNRKWNQIDMYGVTDIWSATAEVLILTLCIYDDESHTTVYEYEPVRLQGGDIIKYEWDPSRPVTEGLSLNGYLIATGGINPENGRYRLTLLYDYNSSRLIGSGWAKDMVSVKLSGAPGTEIEVFADGTYTRLMSVGGQPAPNSNMSISDLACGNRVISVGMYGNRSMIPVTMENGTVEMRETGYEPMQTVKHSSYGILRDGRILPHTTAPGMPLMSAMSRYYLAEFPETEHYITGEDTPWYGEGGTSMSSPFVAGYIATWLEVLPDLKIEDVIDMITESNSHDIPEPDNPRNLSGYFDPIRALRRGLDKNGIEILKNPMPVILPSDKVEIYTLTGQKIYSGAASGANRIAKGIYLICTPYGKTKGVMPGLFNF